MFGRYGLIEKLRPVRTDPTLSYHTASTFGYTASGTPFAAAGIDLDLETALRKAISEALERYCLANRPRKLLRCRESQLLGPRLGFEGVGLFTSCQYRTAGFPYRPWDGTSLYDWCSGTDLHTGAEVSVPADLVWLHTSDQITAGVSTGSAAHVSRNLAILSGLYEVVERDALTIVWETRARTPSLDPFSSWQFAETRELAEQLAEMQHFLILRNITTSLAIPAVVAVIWNDRGQIPCLTIGAAAGPDLAAAAVRAAREAFLSWAWMRDEHARRSVSLTEAMKFADESDDMMWQAYLYGFPNMLGAAEHLLNDAEVPKISPSHSPLSTGRGELQTCLDRLADAGYRCVAVDLWGKGLSTPCLHAVKVVVPGLVPLSIGKRCRHLENPRLSSEPKKMSWPHAPPQSAERYSPIPLP